MSEMLCHITPMMNRTEEQGIYEHQHIETGNLYHTVFNILFKEHIQFMFMPNGNPLPIKLSVKLIEADNYHIDCGPSKYYVVMTNMDNILDDKKKSVCSTEHIFGVSYHSANEMVINLHDQYSFIFDVSNAI